nr:potassium transporter TrkG [Salsipaludibacter albus]
MFRPDRDDLRIIGYYIGKVLVGLAAVMAVPLVVAVLQGALDDVTALVCGISATAGLGAFLHARLVTTKSLDWSHGMVIVALSWLVGSAMVAIPLYLSGHFGSWLDAWFDAMSGLTTSGLSLLQDLDHLSVPMNLLRHLTHFVGGQGIMLVVLTVMASSGARVSTLYVGEGRDDRIVPSIVATSKFIWLVATTWLVAGTAALWATGLVAGLSPGRALFHGVNIFMAAFDTGGFAPYSTSMAYYHSVSMEVVVLVLMVAGTLSFGMHWELWRGRARQLVDNIEMRSLGVTALVTGGIVVFGLVRAGTFDTTTALWRKGVMTLVSAHTGTGFAFNASTLYVTDWGLIAPAGIVIAMALGGMASSTAGGIKAMRVGTAATSILRDVRRAVQPDAAVVVASTTGRSRRVLEDDAVRSAVTVTVLYLLTFLVGAVAGVLADFSLDQALFESTSATANVGLSSGVLAWSNPVPLKLVYLVQMWLGRLEFMTAFALVGFVYAAARAKV